MQESTLKKPHIMLVGGIVALIAVFIFSSTYLIKQGWLLLMQRRHAISVKTIVASPQTTSMTRTFLERVAAIRQFGIADMGLKDTANYRELITLSQDWLVTVVSACKPLSFERYTWGFPFFGASPYLGFFDESDARAEAKRLKGEGWEVWVRQVDAFSTLGILNDPLFSFMENYSEYRLANLILHEQTHATLWARGNFDFNEQLATFLGDQLSLAYILKNHGKDSAEYKEIDKEAQDTQTFYADIGRLRNELQTIYQGNETQADKELSKTQKIKAFQDELRQHYAEHYQTETYRSLADLAINNAFVDMYQNYTGQLPVFQAVFEKCPGLPEFIQLMHQAVQAKDPFAWMQTRLSGQ